MELEERILKIAVENHLYKYITESIGGDTLRAERDSTLLSIIKPHLETEVEDIEIEPQEGFSILKIQLPELRQVYNSQSGRTMYCNTLFRDRLSDKGCNKVRRFLKACFKASFRTFMDGYTESQYNETDEMIRLRVKRGVVAFLLQYHIEFDEKLISTLTRDWYRHQDRNEKNRYSPVLY